MAVLPIYEWWLADIHRFFHSFFDSFVDYVGGPATLLFWVNRLAFRSLMPI